MCYYFSRMDTLFSRKANINLLIEYDHSISGIYMGQLPADEAEIIGEDRLNEADRELDKMELDEIELDKLDELGNDRDVLDKEDERKGWMDGLQMVFLMLGF